ncbi:MAG: RHS repeat-associated core domain-containing protein, partial [Undibacterium sp.]|nr:RHS repeat-associated core domain-containing protein [Undibacterium sp.]
TLGNGLTIERDYFINTGRLDQAKLLSPGRVEQLREGYTFDALGNVNQRNQQWQGNGFIEDFTYDGLNRLHSAKVLGQTIQTFEFDAIGNIQSKTGVGTGNYQYNASGANSIRPHAVNSIPGLGTFDYDANGNMTNGAGRSISWTSFDMPDTMSKNSEWSKFTYGANHQRTKQSKADGTAIYYGGAMELETNNGQLKTLKTYWPMGLGVEIDAPNKATDFNWTHLDRLGSIVAISNSQGQIVEKLAYDSWGKRRTLLGDATPDSIDGVKDNKGFTGHEMLDNLDLVHMNGRIYEPLIARFMSPDPIIQDPEHSQSYNRYTYVWNNPTNLTDPTGFEANCDNRCTQLQNEANKQATDCWWTGGCSYYGSGQVTNSNEAGRSNTIEKTNLSNVPTTSTRRELTLTEYNKNDVTGEWDNGIDVDHVNTEHGFLNGMYNTKSYAKTLAIDHLARDYPNVTSFTLAYNPTHGLLADFWESFRDKIGFTTQVTREFAGVLQDIQQRGKDVKWVVHSQGGIIFSEAARISQGGLSHNFVSFHSGANNILVTNSILKSRNISTMGYLNPVNDPVPNIGGMNTLNPIVLLRSLLQLYNVIWGDVSTPEHPISPHTWACRSCTYTH